MEKEAKRQAMKTAATDERMQNFKETYPEQYAIVEETAEYYGATVSMDGSDIVFTWDDKGKECHVETFEVIMRSGTELSNYFDDQIEPLLYY